MLILALVLFLKDRKLFKEKFQLVISTWFLIPALNPGLSVGRLPMADGRPKLPTSNSELRTLD